MKKLSVKICSLPIVDSKQRKTLCNAPCRYSNAQALVDNFRVPGLVIGSPSACHKYMESEIEKTITLTKKLSKIAKITAQKAYSWCTKGVQNKLSFLARATPEAFEKVVEIKKNIRW